MLKLQAEMVSDLYEAGRTEDGEMFVAEVYFVQLEQVDGRRWRHESFARGATREVDPETGWEYFGDVREEARAKMTRLADRVNAALESGGSVNWNLWYEVEPAYGSPVYQREGCELERAFEERQRELEGRF